MRSRYLSGLAVVLLSGCALLSAQRTLSTDEIDALVAEQNYGQALTALDNIPADHPQSAPLLVKRGEVQELARDYESAVLARVRARGKKQEYAAALSELRAALANYPQSKRLAEEQKRMLPQSKLAQREVNDRLLIARVQYLFDELPLQRRLARLDPDYPISRLTDLRAQLDRSTGELLECGQHAMHAGNLERAELCLTLAKRIQDTQLARIALQALEEKQTQREKAARKEILRSKDISRRRQIRQLMAQSNEALAREDLLEAREALKELLAIDPDNTDALALREAVDATLAARLEGLLRQGNQLYRSGNIEQAKRVWEEGLLIDPEHTQLRANVQRAESVLQNLEDLQQSNPVRQ